VGREQKKIHLVGANGVYRGKEKSRRAAVLGGVQ
jgi:hypothetical protein